MGKLLNDSMYYVTTLDSKGVYHNSASRSLDLKAHIVCEPCNNGWMSDIESEAKPIMRNMILRASWVSLLPLGIATIATFLFKAAVVADCNRPSGGNRFFSYEVRRRFRRSLAIPVGVQMWISVVRRKGKAGGRFSAAYVTIEVGKFRGFQFYVFTYIIGALVLQLTAPRWVGAGKRPQFKPKLTQNSQMDNSSIAFWPSNGSPITWPPSVYLGDDSLKLFADRWERLVEAR